MTREDYERILRELREAGKMREARAFKARYLGLLYGAHRDKIWEALQRN